MLERVGAYFILIVFLLVSLRADAQPYADDPAAALNAEIARLAPRTFVITGIHLDTEVPPEENKTFSVFLEANTRYTAIALCAGGCGQLTFSLRDGTSVLTGESSGRKSISTINFKPSRTEYYVGAFAAGTCDEGNCRLHLAVLRETGNAPIAPRAPDIRIQAPPATPPPATFSSFPNTDLAGSELAQLRNVNEGDCLGACRSNTECAGYSFDKWNGWCFLKKSAVSLTIDAQSRSAVKSGIPVPARSGAQPAIQRYRNRAFPETESGATAVAAYDECEGRCARSESCMAFTYFKKLKRCGVSSDPGTYISNPDADSGAKRPPR